MSNQLKTNLNTILADKNTNLLPENLKAGVTCLGVEGNLENLDTSDATAVANDIASEKTAYVNGEKVTGTMRYTQEYGLSFSDDLVNETTGLGDAINVSANTANFNMIINNTKITIPVLYETLANHIGITPEKIMEGNTILGVEGTGQGGTVEIPVKLFTTVDNMNADADVEKGDLALVYGFIGEGITSTSKFSKLYFPKTVVLSEAFTEDISCGFNMVEYNDYVYISSYAYLKPDSFTWTYDDMMGTYITVSYTSADGITYTRTDENESSISFSYALTPSSSNWNDIYGNFMQTGQMEFNGLYEHNGTNYIIAPTQLTAKSADVYNTTFYGKNGIETGAMDNITTIDELTTNISLHNTFQTLYLTGSMEKAFYNSSDEVIDTSYLDTTEVTSMKNMFWECGNITSLDVSNFNTNKVTRMDGMFQQCYNVTELDVSRFDTSNVTQMAYMFSQCNSLASLNLTHFNTTNVTGMGGMFQDCSSLTELDLSSFDTSNNTSLEDMFGSCSGLTELDLSNFDTSKVTRMGRTFAGCTNLVTLDLSNADFSKVTYGFSMFSNCTSLQTVYVKDSTAKTFIDEWLEEAGLSTRATIK